jgi:hypothetical protein
MVILEHYWIVVNLLARRGSLAGYHQVVRLLLDRQQAAFKPSSRHDMCLHNNNESKLLGSNLSL